MDEDSAWVFDSLICFLNGPVWNAPLQSFIEEKSLVFEPNVSESEEYLKVFDEFKNLVDFMLGNFMEDIGITPTQFESACHRGNREGIPINFDQNLFELIWAANDYDMFKRMMTQRNVELQLQALELIEQKYGITPESFIPKGKESQHNAAQTNAEDSSTGPAKTPHLEEEIMEEVIQQFPKGETEESTTADVEYLLEEHNALKETLKNIEIARTIPEPVPVEMTATDQPTPAEIPPVQQETPISQDGNKQKLKSMISKEELSFDKKPKAEVDAIELKKRQEYLKAQRDKLVALKKEARKKHLNQDATTIENLKKRPKSAKAAENLLLGSTAANIDPEKLQFRKALVERLKTEVITNKGNDEQF